MARIGHIDIAITGSADTHRQEKVIITEVHKPSPAGREHLNPVVSCICNVDIVILLVIPDLLGCNELPVIGPVSLRSAAATVTSPFSKKVPVAVKLLYPVVEGIRNVNITSTVNRRADALGKDFIVLPVGTDVLFYRGVSRIPTIFD